MTPCIVITRDRVTHLRQCLASLNDAGCHLDLHIVDHGSTWPPMLDLLKACPYPVHRCGDKPPRELWEWDGLAKVVGRKRYLVTDPDLELARDCPIDWLDALGEELDHGGVVKAGLGLRIDDLPSTLLSEGVRMWEKAFWQDRRPSGLAWRAPVDTTTALHLPLTVQPKFQLAPAARLDAPYLVRHLPWYTDLDPAETAYYRDHLVPGSSHWANGGW